MMNLRGRETAAVRVVRVMFYLFVGRQRPATRFLICAR
jgi:hypothetical protein